MSMAIFAQNSIEQNNISKETEDAQSHVIKERKRKANKNTSDGF